MYCKKATNITKIYFIAETLIATIKIAKQKPTFPGLNEYLSQNNAADYYNKYNSGWKVLMMYCVV